LVSASDGTTTVYYQYDGQGRRIERTVDGTTEHDYYSGQQIIETCLPDANGALQPQYQYVWSLLYTNTPIFRDSYSGGVLVAGARLYYLTDANHNVTAVTDATASVVERYDYDAYGSATIYCPDWSHVLTTSMVGNTRLFAGQEFDSATGLYDARARWYDPATGTFLARDPMGFAAGDMNTYRYVGDSPTDATDPTGLCADKDFLTSAGGFFYGFGNRLTDAAQGIGGMLQQAGEGWGDLAYLAYSGAATEDLSLTANVIRDGFNGVIDESAKAYLELAEDPSLALGVAADATAGYLSNKLSTAEGIGELSADALMLLAPMSNGVLGAEADARVVQFAQEFLADETGAVPWPFGRQGPADKFGALDQVEQATLLRTEAQEGIELFGNPVLGGQPDAFWKIDSSTCADVDFVGKPGAYQNWGKAQAGFLEQIGTHAQKYDFTVVDLTGASESQIYQILERIDSLPKALRNGIITTGW